MFKIHEPSYGGSAIAAVFHNNLANRNGQAPMMLEAHSLRTPHGARTSRSHTALAGLLLPLLLAACEAPAPERSRPAISEPFATYFAATDSVKVRPTPSAILTRVSEFTTDARGRFFIPDGSEGNVKVITSEGLIERTIGRKGGGPGEFARPGVSRFDASTNALHVLDVMTGRIQVFDDTGGVTRLTFQKRAAPITSLDVLPSGTYLIAQELARETAVLHEVDSTGNVLHSFLPLGGRYPPNVPKRSDWNSLRAQFFSRRGDTVFVVSTLSDSMWTVDRTTQRIVRAEAIPVPGYSPPKDLPLQSGLRGPSLVVAWARSFHRPSRIITSNNAVFVSFTKGAVFQGDSTITMMRDSAGVWRALTGAPVLLGARDSALFGTPDITADTLSIVTFLPRKLR